MTDIKKEKVKVKLDNKIYDCEPFGFKFWDHADRVYLAVEIDGTIYAIGMHGISCSGGLFYFNADKGISKSIK